MTRIPVRDVMIFFAQHNARRCRESQARELSEVGDWALEVYLALAFRAHRAPGVHRAPDPGAHINPQAGSIMDNKACATLRLNEIPITAPQLAIANIASATCVNGHRQPLEYQPFCDTQPSPTSW